MIKSLCREPLLHFLVLGSVLFAVWFYQHPEQESPQPEKPTIIVTESRIDNLIDVWTKTRQRPPTPQELRGLVDDYLQEEIFYREALAMKLDEDDTIIRRRMRQKMELFVEDFATAAQQSDEQLEEYLSSHPDQFRVDPLISLRQIYLNPDKHPDSLEQDVEQLLKVLDDSSNPEEYGDTFLLPASYQNLPLGQLAQMFGGEFGLHVADLPTKTWSGPVSSGYGVHLVYLDEKIEGRLPPLDEIRPVVEREWFAQKRTDSKREFYEKLRERYEIIIETNQEDSVAQETSP